MNRKDRFVIYENLYIPNKSKTLNVLVINTLSSFFLGLFLSILSHFSSYNFSEKLVLFFSIGFLGSLSSFSSFVYDLFNLCLQFKFSRALQLFILSSSLGIIAFVFGLKLLGNE